MALEKEKSRVTRLQADLKAAGAAETSNTAGGGGLDADVSCSTSLLVDLQFLKLLSRVHAGG